MKHCIIIILPLIFLIISCDPADNKLTLENGTSDTIFYFFNNCKDSLELDAINQNTIDENFYLYPIEPKSHRQVPVFSTKWEDYINDSCKDSLLRIFFFSNKLIKSTKKSEILKYQLYTKKYTLNVKTLEEMKWKIIIDALQ